MSLRSTSGDVAGPVSQPHPRVRVDGRTPALDRGASRALERALAHAFAPMHKAAMGAALGLVAALLIFGVTAARLLAMPPGPTHLGLLSQFFAGYAESWPGAIVGAAWGAGVGFVAGWFAAFVHNLVVATWLLLVRARAELTATRDFLDHI